MFIHSHARHYDQARLLMFKYPTKISQIKLNLIFLPNLDTAAFFQSCLVSLSRQPVSGFITFD